MNSKPSTVTQKGKGGMRPFGWKTEDELFMELVVFLDASPHGIGVDVVGTSDAMAFLYDRLRQRFSRENIVLAYVPSQRNHDLDTGDPTPRDWISIGFPTKTTHEGGLIYWIN